MNEHFLPHFGQPSRERIRRVHTRLREALEEPAQRHLLVFRARAYVLSLLAKETLNLEKRL